MQQNNADWTQRVLPQMVDHMLATAPAGADTKSGATEEQKFYATSHPIFWDTAKR